MRTHTGEGLHTCPHCENTFYDPGVLKNHISTHSTERSHVCTICQKAFLTLRVLQSHMTMYRNTRPFMCQDCGKRFKRQTHLNVLTVTHTDIDKGYICTFCNISYARDSTLKEHLNIHTGKLKHQCQYCELAFVSSTVLKNHRSSSVHSSERPHVCNICQKTFSSKAGLWIHTMLTTFL